MVRDGFEQCRLQSCSLNLRAEANHSYGKETVKLSDENASLGGGAIVRAEFHARGIRRSLRFTLFPCCRIAANQQVCVHAMWCRFYLYMHVLRHWRLVEICVRCVPVWARRGVHCLQNNLNCINDPGNTLNQVLCPRDHTTNSAESTRKNFV